MTTLTPERIEEIRAHHRKDVEHLKVVGVCNAWESRMLRDISDLLSAYDALSRDVTRPFRHLTQAIMHDPPKTYGDCQRTCLAMVLGMEPGQIPHFADENIFAPDAARKAERSWLGKQGYGYISVPVSGEWGLNYIRELTEGAGAPVTVSGKSSRGEWNHDVVMFAGNIFDPHPDHTGLSGPCIDKDKPGEPEWYWLHMLLPLSASPRESAMREALAKAREAIEHELRLNGKGPNEPDCLGNVLATIDAALSDAPRQKVEG